MNKKIALIVGIVLIVVIVAVLGFNFLSKAPRGSEGASELAGLSKAVEEEDIKFLKDHIKVEGLDRKLEDQELEDISKLLGDISLNSLDRDSSENNIYIKKDGKKNLFFDRYIIVLKTYDLSINSSNMEGTEVFIDGEKVGEFKEDEEFLYKDLLPGTHKVKLLFQGDYAKLEKEEEILAFNSGKDNEVYVPLSIEGDFVYIDSNIKDATLFIDDEDTGIDISEGYKLGPLDNRELKIYAQGTEDGKKVKSEVEKIQKDIRASYNLDIEKKEDPKEEKKDNKQLDREVSNLFKGYELGLIDAVNYGSYDYIDPYIEVGSPLMESQKKLINNLYSKGTTEELLSYNIEGINEISDGKISVVVSEKHMIYYANGESKEVKNKWNYTLVRDGGLLLRDLKAAK